MRSKMMIVLVCGLITHGAWTQESGQAKIEELKGRIEVLEQQLDGLEKLVEGTAHPINLARTSLASVTASSVNGSRTMNNVFYGVLNAFDDGNNWHNSINYTYWLTGGDPRPWVDVKFDQPVSINTIVVEGGPTFSTQFEFAKGGDRHYLEADGQLKLDRALHGVKRVRLTFEQESGNVQVHEIRVLGYVPPGWRYEVGTPRLLVRRCWHSPQAQASSVRTD